jgi:type II secretory ATPase GspE/PulE/Tfp pilus assembly ATPase PilB-like protein
MDIQKDVEISWAKLLYAKLKEDPDIILPFQM